MSLAFGPFVADRAAYLVTRDGQPLALSPKLLDLLFHFLEHPGTLITKEALLDEVWPGANVTDNALSQAISELRQALGDVPASPHYIRTIARRGYRFIAPVTSTPAAREDHAAETSAEAPAAVESPTAHAAPATALPSLAVLDFSNLSGEAETAWLGAGIAETVASDVAALHAFDVVDRVRVLEATRAAPGDPLAAARLAGATRALTGAFQRAGASLRITVRLTDVESRALLADLKLDGRLDDLFGAQDAIVPALARALHLEAGPEPDRRGARETASLEAFRAYTEGWLKIESLDTDQVGASIADFSRAIDLDPHYAAAYTGLANAEFVAFEMTRAQRTPQASALASGIAHARHAVSLDPALAEAHATLSFLLSSAQRFAEAREAARAAVRLEPGS